MDNLKKLKFVGFESNYPESEIVFIGIPFDGTSSYRAGSRFGPIFLREASDSIETYSIVQKKDLLDRRICDAGDMTLPVGNTERALQEIEARISSILRDGKKVFSFGGEHLITLPVLKAFLDSYEDLFLIYIDAHADLRDEYLGERLSHATVLRRVCEILSGENIFHIGTRSGEKSEIEFGEENINFYPSFVLEKLEEVNERIPASAPVYLSVDLDVLDPSVAPGVGNPEPGGISFNSLLNCICMFGEKNIVGMDIVELSPHYDPSGVSAIVAAKLVREMILLFK